nr:amidohydrolase [Nocardia transvalensis]
MIQWRRSIHARPELSHQEFATTEFVASTLADAGLQPKVMTTGAGLVCDFGPDNGIRIALRADLDALPIQEFTGAEYSSKVDGVAHACGHDAHTVMLLGAALALHGAPSLPAGVRLIFQPAEETVHGALDVIATGAMSGVTRLFALHCDPRLPVGRVGLCAGPLTSAADYIDLRVDAPDETIGHPYQPADPIYSLGTAIVGLPGMLSRRVDPRSGTTMAWGAIEAGNARGSASGGGKVTGTLRTGDHATWLLLEPLVREIIQSLLAPTGVRYQLDYRRAVPPVVNDAESVRIFAEALRVLGPDMQVDTEQSGGGEDFAWYLEEVPGAMGRLGVWSGSGPQFDLHQPTFDIDERALAVGTRVLANLVLASA